MIQAQPQNDLAKKFRAGQVAVVLIVAIAVGLILFAAAVNMTLVSQAKTYTMKGANVAASTMASTIASYGQKQWEETMGRRLEYCKGSRGGLISIIILIIYIIIAIYTGYYAGGFEAGVGTFAGNVAYGATVAAVMQGASIMISATTDPGISEAWNKMQAAVLSTTGQFVERGVMAGLQSTVTDSVRIPDKYDLDQDGHFGYPLGSTVPNDEISRMAYYITKRYLELPGPETDWIRNFLNELHEFVLRGGDGWGLVDPVLYPDGDTAAPGLMKRTCANPSTPATHACLEDFYLPCTTTPNPAYNQRPAECDPCCRQAAGTDDDPVPENCSAAAGAEQVGDRSTCAARTPFREAGNVYQYLYDPTYENATNAFFSFREQLGRDDEHIKYNTIEPTPNWHSSPLDQPQVLIPPAGISGFLLRDIVGFYTTPGYSSNTDIWVNPSPPSPPGAPPAVPRLFHFFYKMKYLAPQLSTATYAGYECHWCDADKPADPGRTCPSDFGIEARELFAPFAPAGRLELSQNPTTMPYNDTQGWCVNKTTDNKGGANDPPVASDNIRGLGSFLLNDNECAITNVNYTSDLNAYVTGWKRGSDRFCSNLAGKDYDLECPKFGGVADSVCPGPGDRPDLWPDDMFDDMIYNKIPELFATESNLYQAAQSNEGLITLAQNITEWYGKKSEDAAIRFANGIADWIEPPCPNPDDCPGSATKLERPGTLWVWRTQLKYLDNLLSEWLVPPGTPGKEKYSTDEYWGPNAVWCVPQATTPFTPAEEIATFDFNGNSLRGDILDSGHCLNWNVNDTDTFGGGVAPATGNAEKFDRCLTECTAQTSNAMAACCANRLADPSADCATLPRSLVPDYYDHMPMQFYPGHQALFENCLASTTIEECNARCQNFILPSGTPYVIPVFNAPTMDGIDDITAWCDTIDPSTGVPPGADGTLLNDACNGGGGTRYALNCLTNKTQCRCSWANDCNTLALECGATCPVGSYCDAITQAIIPSKGSCGNADAPAFLLALQQSATEAQMQVEKFRKRLDFLVKVYTDVLSIRTVLATAIDKIEKFIDGGTDYAVNSDDSPSERFIKKYMQVQASMGSGANDLPPFAVYVWQDKDPSTGTRQGYWHAVKVEVRMPRRCAGNCIAKDWPKITSRTSGGFFSKKVCYKLENLVGMVKARVVRYDQDKDFASANLPGGELIWKNRMTNPTMSSAPDPTGLRTVCAGLIDTDLSAWLGDLTREEHHLGAAFMFNKIPDLASGDDYADCWLKVHNQMLAHGVMSETCAQYYFVDGVGFRVKFVPCDNW